MLKQLWGFQQLRCRDIAKNLVRAQTIFARSNLCAIRRGLIALEAECVL
ncbi:MAG: hypothetical protein ACQGVK_15580 [Myxococcota bacterium]